MITYYIFPGLPTRLRAQLTGADPDYEVQRIFEAACEAWEITVQELRSKDRARKLAQARQFCVHQIHQHTTLSLNEIARRVNFRDHSTVIHSKAKVEGINERNDPEFYEKIQRALKILNN